MMSYISGEPFATNYSSTDQRLLQLHEAIHPRVRSHNLDLHPRWQKSSIVTRQSAACFDSCESFVLTYFRSREEAARIEALMGRDEVAQSGSVDPRRHPVIEIRQTEDHYAVELVLSPNAWWDQQNLVGKLELPQHRAAFRRLLQNLDPNFRFGFWNGLHLDDMHLTVAQLLRGRVLDEWTATFADRQDWLRIGRWYDVQDPILTTGQILLETFEAIRALHPIYGFILWSGNNDFRTFYEKRAARRYSRRAHA